MSVNHKLGSAWRFSYRIVLPVVLAVGIAIATVAGFVFWSTAKSDERALGRETHLVAHVIDEEAKSLIKAQDYYANWDEALTALKNNDIGWIDDNLGSELYDNGHYDRIYVLDPKARPVYAMYQGGKTAAGNFEADRSVITPMIAKLKGIDASGALAAYDNGNTDKVPRVSDMAEVDGRAAFVAIMPIMSDSGDVAQVPGSENFVVCIRFLDAALAKELMDQYLINNAAFQPQAATDPTLASFAVKNAAGSPVAWFVWSPDRPGAQILAETLPAMLGGLAVAGIVLVFLLRGLRRTTSALEAGKATAEYQAHHDTLTGLANRALFNKRLEEALGSSSNGSTSVALLALDLDRFKQVNDTLGHEAGDQLLREVGDRLSPLVASSDTLARLGGDEFAIIQRHIRSPDEASALSSRIIAALGAPFVLAGRIAQIGVSIGIVITPAAQAARDLASKADMALYEAKASGRNQYKIFDPHMQDAATYRETIGAELKAAHLTVPQRVA
jgi:diguanylate cyclase (GGDEF)-like protein